MVGNGLILVPEVRVAILDELAGAENFPFLVGRDSHGCNRAGSISVFCYREINDIWLTADLLMR